VATTAEESTGMRRLTTRVNGSTVLAVAIMVTNVGTYGFQILAARMLGPEAYGAVASLMALLLVLSVAQLGLQATAARRVAADPTHTGQIEGVVLSVTYRASLALGALMLVLSPVVWHGLQLDSIAPAIVLAFAAVPSTIVGGQMGILQGERRWWRLAAVYLGVGIPRLALGTIFLAISPTETSAVLGVLIALCVPVAIGWWALRRPRSEGRRSEEHAMRPTLAEVMHSSLALLAFFILSNVDVMIARNVMSDHQAGLYAGGLILTKAVMFLPQVVVVLAFPSMSTEDESRGALVKSLGAVGAAGVASVLASWVLSGIAMIFVGGDKYQAIEGRLWLFAVLGTMLAVLQVLVYAVLARQHRKAGYLVWVAVVALIGLGLTMGTVTHLLLTVSSVDLVLTAVLLVTGLRRSAHTPDTMPA